MQRALVRLAADWAGRLGPDVIATGGRTLRRSFGDASARSPLHVAGAFAAGARLALGQVRVGGRSNGTTAPPTLPDPPCVAGCTVTADAMHARRDTARRITEAGGGHVPAPGGNRETLHDDVRIRMADPENAGRMPRFRDVDRATGAPGPAGGGLPRLRCPAGPASLARPVGRRAGDGDAGCH